LRLLVLAASVALAGSGLTAQTQARGEHTTNRFTEDFDLVVPASDSCTGEEVHIFGPIDVTEQTAVDSDGGLHVALQFTPHLTAVGLTSGLRYRAVGPAHVTTEVNGSSSEVTAFFDDVRGGCRG
jgi:hypothetical protein